jgi:hypothetical protein
MRFCEKKVRENVCEGDPEEAVRPDGKKEREYWEKKLN